MKNGFYFVVRAKVLRLVKQNWGFPFIAGFMFLLFIAAVFSAAGVAYVAEGLADSAYFVLVLGVLLQFVCLTFGKRKSQGVLVDGSD